MPKAPHVVAVVVVHNPGTWFQEMLDSLRDCDYPNISSIFVDTSSDVDVTSAILTTIPAATIIKADPTTGFGAACNIGAHSAKNATHLLFCHDDVAFAPDAIRKMVEEAFLMNAGVVTPKYVVWNSPSKIFALGASMDRTGTLVSRVDVGDLDQGQYDISHEVFVAPGGATLVRKDLFDAIKGFDERMFLYYEDADLSWRAQIAGARIVAAPLAKVRHLLVSTLGSRRARGGRRKNSAAVRSRLPRHDRIRYSRKNQLRALLGNTRGFPGLVSLAQYFVLSVVEVLYFLITGKPKIAFSIFESWPAVVTSRRSIRRKQKSISHYQVKSDAVLRKQMTRGSARVKGFINSRKNFKGQVEEARRISAWRDYSTERSFLDRLTKPSLRRPKDSGRFDESSALAIAMARLSRIFMWLMIGFVLVGTRQVIFGNIPLVGQFLPFGPAHTLLATYFSGPPHHHGPVTPSPTSDLILGALGYAFFGGTGIEADFIFAALIAMGLLGLYRIVADFRNRTAAYVAVALYAIGPILGGVISSASLSGLVIYSLAPWVLLRMFRLSNLPGIFRSPRLSTRYELAVEGIWLGLIFAFAPSFIFVFALIVLVIGVVGNLLGYVGSSKRYFATQAGALVLAIILNSPWILSLFLPGTQASALFGSAGPAHVGISWLLLMQVSQTFPVESLFGVFLVAFIASFIFVRERRADRVLTLLAIFCVMLVAAIFSSYGAFGQDPIPLAIVMPIAYLAVVTVIGSGIEAAFTSLPAIAIGWRHLVIGLSVLSVLVASYAMLGGNSTGRYQLISRGYESSLSWMVKDSSGNPGEVLWLGRPGTLPIGSYQISSDMSAGVTEIGNPTVESLYSSSNSLQDQRVISAVKAAVQEDTVYLGKQLAALRIKYIVIPQSSISNPSFLTSDLNLMLSRQRDLNQLVADPSVVAFSVTDPIQAIGTTHLSGTESALNMLRFALDLAVAVLWLGLIEAALSRRSVALWLSRRFLATNAGQTISTVGRLFRWSINSENITKIGQTKREAAKLRNEANAESAPPESGYAREIKHVRITSVGEDNKEPASSDSPDDGTMDAQVTHGES